MTVQSEVSRNVYLGNGVTVVFPVTFRFLDNSHVQLLLQGPDPLIPPVTLVETTDYVLTGARAISGGAALLIVSPGVGYTLVIQRNVPLTQLIDFKANDPFPEESSENGLDQLTMALQEAMDVVDRSIHYGPTQIGARAQLPPLVPLALVQVSADGLGFDMGDPSGTGDMLLRPDLAAADAAKGAALVSFAQSGTGAVFRTVRDKLRDNVVTPEDFGAVGDGVANDTTAMTNFFNHAIANPNVTHRLSLKTYGVSAALPTINANNVIITGMGASLHDAGTLLTGSVIKWIGSAGFASPIVKISAVSGGAQRLASVTFTGIGIDCVSGAANIAMEALSVFSSDIDVAIANAAVTGLNLNVVASLTESKDLQRCNIRVNARQIEAPNGVAVRAGGDAVANTSFNTIKVLAQNFNVAAVICTNSDNNDWSVTAIKAGGAAAACVELHGGATSALTSRGERFLSLSSNLPLRAFGTGTYAVASIHHNIYCLDKENGTPDPVVDTGASVFWQNSDSPLADTPWIPFTPNFVSSAGTITTKSSSGQYADRGNIRDFKIALAITTNGTGSGVLNVTMPNAAAGSVGSVAHGLERAVTGKAVSGFLDASSSTLIVRFYDGTYPGANGHVINIAGCYEIA